MHINGFTITCKCDSIAPGTLADTLSEYRPECITPLHSSSQRRHPAIKYSSSEENVTVLHGDPPSMTLVISNGNASIAIFKDRACKDAAPRMTGQFSGVFILSGAPAGTLFPSIPLSAQIGAPAGRQKNRFRTARKVGPPSPLPIPL